MGGAWRMRMNVRVSLTLAGVEMWLSSSTEHSLVRPIEYAHHICSPLSFSASSSYTCFTFHAYILTRISWFVDTSQIRLCKIR
jgi:hypothetical protein